jgi:DNA-binding NtrC family response regulator
MLTYQSGTKPYFATLIWLDVALKFIDFVAGENMMFILSVGCDSEVLNRRSSLLAEAGYAIVSITNLPKAAEKIANEEFDVAILCNSLAEEDRRQLVNMGRRHRPFMPVILIPERSSENDVRRLVINAIGETLSGQAISQVA